VIACGTNLEWRVDLAQPSGRYQRTRHAQAACRKTGVARVATCLQCSSTLAARMAGTTVNIALPAKPRIAPILLRLSRRPGRGVANAATLAA